MAGSASTLDSSNSSNSSNPSNPSSSELRATLLEGRLAIPKSPSRLAVRAGRRALHTVLDRLQEGRVVLVEDGREEGFGHSSQALPGEVRVTVEDPRFFSSLVQGVVGAAEAYMVGYWSCDDIALLVRILLRNDAARGSFDGVVVKLSEPVRRIVERMRKVNTRRGSRRNIEAHYDLGNDFYELFLDPTLTYSAGIFEALDASMEQASLAKYDRLCRKLDLGPKDHVLEIGTGWGGFAMHAASRYGCRVTTTTISREQHDLASERVARAGLESRVRLLLEDYRDLGGRFDKLVSIEMIEAVGHEFFDTYFQVCSERLEPHGMMALQAIAIDDGEYERARRTVDFVRKHIFPGGSLPSIEVMSRCIARTGDMRIVHLEDITPHYAETLRRWRQRFMSNLDAVRELGYSEAFLRMWEFYLAYCEGGFDERRSKSVQLLLAKPDCRRPPVLGAF
jgi:cyclopropane-fatty-acyl-phospholipid synthase